MLLGSFPYVEMISNLVKFFLGYFYCKTPFFPPNSITPVQATQNLFFVSSFASSVSLDECYWYIIIEYEFLPPCTAHALFFEPISSPPNSENTSHTFYTSHTIVIGVSQTELHIESDKHSFKLQYWQRTDLYLKESSL